MKRIMMLLASISTLLVLGSPSVVFAQSATQQAKDQACQGVSQLSTNGANMCDPNAAGVDVGGILRTGLELFSFVVGVAAVVMIVIGGFKYITSGGDSARVSSAKDTILYSIVGLVVAVLAQVIVQFVLKRIPG